MIFNLPQNLPEALERALEGIIDNSYEGKILQLVLAAECPLTVDELRVALTVSPGETVWYGEKLPKDGAQLMCLCGGILLEVDDEDGKIRFIHHSVIQHLLTPATRPSTAPFHFSLEDAHNFAGSVCVTYLHLPVFESRMIMSNKLRGAEVAEKARVGAEKAPPVISLLLQHIKSEKRASRASYDFDLGLLALRDEACRREDSFDFRSLHKYASDNWLSHTRYFMKYDTQGGNCWDLWWRIVCGQLDHVKLPFDAPDVIPLSALDWASSNEHYPLMRSIWPLVDTRELDTNFLITLSNSLIKTYGEIMRCAETACLFGLGHIPQLNLPDVQNMVMKRTCRVVFLAHLAAELVPSSIRSTEKDHALLIRLEQTLAHCISDVMDSDLQSDLHLDLDSDSQASSSLSALWTALLQLPVAQEELKKGCFVQVLPLLYVGGTHTELRTILANHPYLRTTYVAESPLSKAVVEKSITIIAEEVGSIPSTGFPKRRGFSRVFSLGFSPEMRLKSKHSLAWEWPDDRRCNISIFETLPDVRASPGPSQLTNMNERGSKQGTKSASITSQNGQGAVS